MSTTRTYEELAIGVEHESGTFDFEPPADATVRRKGRPDHRRFENLTAATAAVPFDLSSVPAAVPPAYEFQGALLPSRENRTTLSLLYYDGTQSISISVSDADSRFAADSIERDLGAIDGALTVSDDGRVYLSWDCTAQYYRINGPSPPSELLDIATEIGCPSASGAAGDSGAGVSEAEGRG